MPETPGELQRFLQRSLLSGWQDFFPKGVKAELCLFPLNSIDPALAQGELWDSLSDDQKARGSKISAPERKRQWWASRTCEQILRARLGPTAYLSLTHSPPWCLGLGWEVLSASTGTRLGTIGVDLERSDRAIPAALELRLRRSEEASLALLDLWVIKEACFKADPLNAGQVVWNYRVHTYDPVTGVGTAIPPQADSPWQLHFIRVQASGWTAASAWSMRSMRPGEAARVRFES